MFSDITWGQIGQASLETLYMVALSTIGAVVLGLPLGIWLYLCGPGGVAANRPLYQVLSVVVNIVRSVPFIILLIALIPITEWIVGTSIGVNAAIVPLVVGAAPFYARIAETSFREVDPGVVEAAQSMGASIWQLIFRVLLPEARPGLISGATITAVTLISYSAMSGVIGGGGLGDLAVRYGYERFETGVMLLTTALMIVLVEIMQWVGDRAAYHFARRER
ncbi:methionine ABC transporter permease [Alicyclobacillus fructus]|uniref:methionine ABC transporter permease n=1 Tax=Alicyclobacillus fructus TaxID=2816082 RepID=UPI001A8ECD6C|nr:methionine ABC transporter permease [Alicyclobacillus fructus]